MNQDWAERILRSYESLLPHMSDLTRAFYDRLFEVRPDTRALFRIDMELQRQHLAALLAVIVRNLRMLDAIEDSLRELGAQHARVGVRPEHYPVVRDAMLHAFARTVPQAWNSSLEADWRRLLEIISNQMLAGALTKPPNAR